MFSIYACTVTSLSNEECLALTSVSKSQLLEQYHKITQQALARAGLLGTLDVVVLQAAVLFLYSVCQLLYVKYLSFLYLGKAGI
jgi:hypothetical protein